MLVDRINHNNAYKYKIGLDFMAEAFLRIARPSHEDLIRFMGEVNQYSPDELFDLTGETESLCSFLGNYDKAIGAYRFGRDSVLTDIDGDSKLLRAPENTVYDGRLVFPCDAEEFSWLVDGEAVVEVNSREGPMLRAHLIPTGTGDGFYELRGIELKAREEFSLASTWKEEK